jgi:hypothetical protein
MSTPTSAQLGLPIPLHANPTIWRLRDLDGRIIRGYLEDLDGNWLWQNDWIWRGSQILASLGDLSAILLGVTEAGVGGGSALTGASCTAATLGACGLAGAPAVVTGGAAALHGLGTVSAGSRHLASGLSFSKSEGNSRSSANLRVLSPKELARRGIVDPEALKAEFVEKELTCFPV